MSISSWRASRRQRKQEAYDKNAYATAEEKQQLKRRGLFRRTLDLSITGGMPEGTGISPGGTPIDFTADEKPPRY